MAAVKRGSLKERVTLPKAPAKTATVAEKKAYLKKLRSLKAKIRKSVTEKNRSKALDKKIAQERRDFYKVSKSKSK